METEEKKPTFDLDIYKEKFEELVIDGQDSIDHAESLQKQVKAAKGQIKAATDLEWMTKKKAYEESRTETEKKKKEYQEIRDKRNTLMNACKSIYDGIKIKIDDYRAECVRKAEEELRAKEEIKRKAMEKEERKLREAEEAKKTQKSKSRKPPQQITPADNSPGQTVDTTATSSPKDTQKPEEGQNEPITQEIDLDFEIYDMTSFLGAIIRGERGATTDLVSTNGDEIMELAEKLNCKPGETIISGCRLIPFDHGDLVT